jgi:hypothetical protein
VVPIIRWAINSTNIIPAPPETKNKKVQITDTNDKLKEFPSAVKPEERQHFAGAGAKIFGMAPAPGTGKQICKKITKQNCWY